MNRKKFFKEHCLELNVVKSIESEEAEESVSNTQIGLANDAVKKKLVSLVDTGCWIVRSADGAKPYVVTLFPKEECSCASKKLCYHVMACRLMLGQTIEQVQKPNVTLLQQQNRHRYKEKPSGRERMILILS